LAEKLHSLNPATKIIALSFDDPSLAEYCLGCDLIVNTSSVGLKEGDPSIIPAACLKKEHLVYDTIYQPSVTPLLAMAQGLDCRTANGLSMLINQGALAFQHWFPGTDPLPIMKRAMRG
jgi:shikimate dehydrogenase